MTTSAPRGTPREDLLELARAGVPYSVIGERFGITRQAAYQMAARAGISLRNPNKVHNRVTPAMIRARADALHAALYALADEREATEAQS